MFCGYACIVYSMRGEFGTAAPFIGLAMVLDMLDGPDCADDADRQATSARAPTRSPM